MVSCRAVVGSLVALAGLSLACGDSRSSLTPSSPTPTSPTRSSLLTIRSVSPSSGPTSGGEAIIIAGTGFQYAIAPDNSYRYTPTVTVDGIAAQVRQVTDVSVAALMPPHPLGPVDLVVKNPDGQTATLQGGYTYAAFSVTASPNVVAPDGDVSVSFSAPSGRGCGGGGDWIAIYPVGAPDDTGAANGHSDLWFDHLCGATSGTRTAKAPSQVGQYEIRYMTGTFSAARSNPVEVRADSQ
jgi:hypothetical protein